MIILANILNEVLNQQQIVDIAKQFMNSESYNSNHDCKRSTFEFIKWTKTNKGFEPVALLLAPPKDIKKFPGKSGDGDSHIFTIINGFGVDFTANQFPEVSEPLKITPETQVPSEYKKIGGYYTLFPDWFENGKTSVKNKFNNLPEWFLDGFEKEGFKPELKEKVDGSKVICDKCNWSWNISDGGSEPYTCHKCGNDNTPISEDLRKWFGKGGAGSSTGGGWKKCK